ncbi:MAG TPA: hypothetical protein VFS18_05015 [Actinomycetota bacterium]|nr:hypothetical protein [Actinomycetota bacterium]
MRGRLGLFIGFGAGYVLGAKAGRERYEQLRRLYDNVQSSPGFKRATGKAKDAVGTGLEQAKGVAGDSVSKVTQAVKERGSEGGQPGNLSVAPPPNV